MATWIYSPGLLGDQKTLGPLGPGMAMSLHVPVPSLKVASGQDDPAAVPGYAAHRRAAADVQLVFCVASILSKFRFLQKLVGDPGSQDRGHDPSRSKTEADPHTLQTG